MTTSEKLLILFQLGWTQSAISQETGIPQGSISRMASGNDPRASNADLIDRLYQSAIRRKAKAA